MDKAALITALNKVGQDETITITGSVTCTSVTGFNISQPITLTISALGLVRYLEESQ
jgi:hypothetical protein